MNSAQAKSSLMGYLRFKKQMHYVATEVHMPAGSLADVVASDGKILVEYEIKISMADLRGDKSKAKHMFYSPEPIVWESNLSSKGTLKVEVIRDRTDTSFVVKHQDSDKRLSWHTFKTEDLAKAWFEKEYGFKAGCPNVMYYVVPEMMWEKHKDKIEESLHPSYGVITFTSSSWEGMGVVKRAKRLHETLVSKEKLRTIVARMSSELAGITKTHYDWVNDFSKFKDLTQKEFDLNEFDEIKSEAT